MRVFPAPGLRVKDPRTRQFIGADGVDVDANDLRFARLLRDGDVLLEDPAADAPEPAPAAAPSKAAAAAAAPAKPTGDA